MTTITIENNFNKLKAEFVKDTGLKVEDNMSLYIQYYHARVMDYYMQVHYHELRAIETNTRKPTQ